MTKLVMTSGGKLASVGGKLALASGCCPSCLDGCTPLAPGIETPSFALRSVFLPGSPDRTQYFVDRYEWTPDACTEWTAGTEYAPPGLGTWTYIPPVDGEDHIVTDFDDDCLHEHVEQRFRCTRIFVFPGAWHDGCMYHFPAEYAILRPGPVGTSSPATWPFYFAGCRDVEHYFTRWHQRNGAISVCATNAPPLYFSEFIRDDAVDHPNINFMTDATCNKLLTSQILNQIYKQPRDPHTLIVAATVYNWRWRTTEYSGIVGCGGDGIDDVLVRTSYLNNQGFLYTAAGFWIKEDGVCQ